MVLGGINGPRPSTDIFSGSLPEDAISYSRKGGCFVSICRGIAISIVILIFIFFLTFTIFFATKYAYDIKPNVTLEDFLNHRPYIIDKRIRTIKHVLPKHYCLYISPIFNQTKKPFSYNGIVWITILSKKPNTKRIEVNVKELEINASDVSVYRSLKLTPLDFDDDPQWASKEQKNSQSRRTKRETETNDEEEDVVTEADPNVGAESIEEEEEDVQTTTEDTSENTKKPRTNRYHHPVLKDDFVPIKVTDVELDEANERLFIYLGTEMKMDVYYIVKIEFSGNMTHDRGLYFTTYEDTANELSYFTATFLEPDARLLFPCLEDHNVQTPYDISVARHNSMVTESIADLEEPETLNSTWFVDEYNRTNLVRASEIGFIVTNMQPKVFQIRENITFIFYAREKYTNDLEYTVDLLKKVIKIYENYFGFAFPYEKVKYVCVPNGSPGQREVKDSMILSSEHHILYSHYFPSTPIDYVDESVSYEIALEWLHRTYEWTNVEQYWVYETLPLFLENVALDQLSLKDGQSDHLTIGDRFRALREEPYFKSTALNLFDNDWDDGDYYNFIKRKGFSILRMFNQSIGQETFQGAVKTFVAERLNRETSILNDCIAENAKNSSTAPRDIPIRDYVSSWEAMEKYPVISVKINKTSGEIKVDHIEFSFEGEAPHQPVSIPIWYTNSTSRNFNAEPAAWIVAPSNTTTVQSNTADLPTDDVDKFWTVLNPLGLGYYRVNYDVETWKMFANILKTSPEVLPYYTRAMLIDDALNLARLGLLNYSVAFDVASYLDSTERNYYVWKETFLNMKFLYNLLRDRPGFEVVERFMIEKIKPLYELVISSETSGTANEEKLRLKSLVFEWACLVGHSPCINFQKQEFYKLIEDDIMIDSKKSLDEDELYLMICTTIRYSGSHEWNILAKSIEQTIDLNEKKTIIRGMGCTREIEKIHSYLKYLTDEELYKLAAEILLSISDNKVGLKYTLDYLYEHWNDVRQYHDLKEMAVLFNKISDSNGYEVFRSIFAKFSDKFTTRDKEILRAISTIVMKTLEWKEKISTWIQY